MQGHPGAGLRPDGASPGVATANKLKSILQISLHSSLELF